MGCCVSTDSSQRARRRSPAKAPPLPPPLAASSSQRTQLSVSSDSFHFHPQPEEETVVKEVLSETPLPKRSSPGPEAKGAGNARKPRLEVEAPETKILISKLEEAAEIVSEYSEMCSAASGSLSTATTVTVNDNRERDRDGEVTSGDRRELGRLQRPRQDSSRSPAKVQRRRQPAVGGATKPPHSHSRSPARRVPVAARPELRGERRDFSGELRLTRPRNASPAGRGAGRGGVESRRSSRSPAPAGRREDRGAITPSRTSRRPPPCAEPPELSSHEAAAAEAADGDIAADTMSEQTNEESLIDNPHVSLECFIFL